MKVKLLDRFPCCRGYESGTIERGTVVQVINKEENMFVGLYKGWVMIFDCEKCELVIE